MPAAIFGPDPDRLPAEEDLLALPSVWMAAACMDGRFRRLSGWLGLAPCTSLVRAFTCRIQARPGVFGLLPLAARPGPLATADFRLFYFPMIDDAMIDRIALPAAIAAAAAGATERIRDFPALPEFAAPFAIAGMRLALSHPGRELGLSLTAPTRRRIAVPAGIAAPDGSWLVGPGGLEEDLPAFELARDLFRALAAGVAAATGVPPDAPLAAEAPANRWTRRPDGSLAGFPDPEAKMRTEVLSWGGSVRAVWPEAILPADAEPYRIARVAAGTEEADGDAAAALKRPRLVVLSGFLGSGKTSFLNQFIEFHAARDQLVAVIQNEIGETGVDSHLLEGEDSVLELDAGCVCCTLAGSLTRGLRQLSESLAPEIVVLETTGLANPMNMLEEFHEIGDLAELAAVVAVVDAARFAENLAASDVAAEQIRAADTVVLNKCDLVDDAERAAILAEIRRRNGTAQIVPAVHGRVNPAVLGEGLSRHAGGQAADAPCPCGCGGHHHHEHHHHHHGVTHLDEGFSALRFALAPVIDRDRLMRILAETPPGVLRIKGLAHLIGEEAPQVIQYVPGRADCEPAVGSVADPPFILVIGRDLDAAALKDLWLSLLDEDSHS
jgi:G3E family GTPase